MFIIVVDRQHSVIVLNVLAKRIVMFVFCSAQVDPDSPGYREAHSEVQCSAVVPDHGER